MSKLLCFGDSITYGAWDSRGGWVARLRKQIDELNMANKAYCLVYNLGISSDTSQSLLNRFDSSIQAHSVENGEVIIAISIGTNDSVRNMADDAYWVELDAFRNNITELIHRSQEVTDKIVVLGSMPVDETKTQPYTYDETIRSDNKDIQNYEHVTKAICDSEGVAFIPVFDGLIGSDYRSLLYRDGVHPNDEGHEYLARLIYEFITSRAWL